MNKIFLTARIVENIVDTKKGSVSDDMILNLPNNKKYKLTIALRLLKDNEIGYDLSDMILLPEDLKKRNYKLYSALAYSKKDNILRDKGLFDDEVEANGKTYKVEVGYIGVKLPIKDNDKAKLVDLVSIFKLEHAEIEKKLNLLRESIYAQEVSYNELNTLLNELYTVFTAHTQKEDLFLYPKKNIVGEFKKINELTTKEIRETYKYFSKYYNNWFNKINLENFKDFQNETNEMVTDMLTRINIEEKEIFKFCS